MLEVVFDFFFFFFLDFLDPTSFERFLSCLGEIVSEGGSKAECHDEVEEAGDPAGQGNWLIVHGCSTKANWLEQYMQREKYIHSL